MQTGIDEKTKEPIYENWDNKADVMIATFKTPGLRETEAAQAAEIESLKETVGALLLSSLEG